MKTILIRSKTTDPSIFKVANTLLKNGNEVELLVWDRQHSLKVDDYPYKIHKFNLKAPYDSYWTLLYLPIWWIYEFIFLIRNNQDLIHSCDFDTLWPAILAKTLKRIKLFYTIYDFYSDSMPYIPGFVRKLVAFLEKEGIGFSDTLFLVDKSRYEQIKGAKIKKLFYIYNSPLDHYNPKEMENEKNNKFIIFYAGSLERSRGLNFMIDAVKDLNSIDLIIGGIGNTEKLIEKASQKNNNIKFLGWLDYDDVIKKSLGADVLFAFYDPKIPINRFASPNKLFEAMMCGKPIITNSNTNASEIVYSENCGIVLEYGDVQILKKTLIKLEENPDLRLQLGLNGRNAFKRKYSWEIMEKRLINAYGNEI